MDGGLTTPPASDGHIEVMHDEMILQWWLNEWMKGWKGEGKGYMVKRVGPESPIYFRDLGFYVLGCGSPSTRGLRL
jgi:hypothetical protein